MKLFNDAQTVPNRPTNRCAYRWWQAYPTLSTSACISAFASAVQALERARRYFREKTLHWYRDV
jgi:hypothetical protein